MAEIQESPTNIEKGKRVIQKVRERVGKFLSETYTVKGATTRNMEQYKGVLGTLSDEQKAAIAPMFEKFAKNNATWKVIRNWVLTGAGIALGGAIIKVGPVAAWGAVKEAAIGAGKWVGATAVEAGKWIGTQATETWAAAKAAAGTLGEKIHIIVDGILGKFNPAISGGGIPGRR